MVASTRVHTSVGLDGTRGGHRSRLRDLVLVAVALALVSYALVAMPQQAVAACTGNGITYENEKAGTPQSTWDINGAGDPAIQGFATQMSVNAGSAIQFKISSAAAFSIKIYRLGYYQGNGAREVATIASSATVAKTQPACFTSSDEIYDCGAWTVSASWNVPSDAVSGVYLARLIRNDTGGDSHIPFVVRNDNNTSALLFQTSDTTWQAYNDYAGSSNYYQGQAHGRAYKLSYNRPFNTRAVVDGRDYLFSNEYPMIRFLEENGYDVFYVSGLDVDADANLLTKHKTFMSVGHDEYWTKNQRAHVTAARDAKVNLAFFGGNDVYWKSRLEPSQDGSNTANRTLVTYKDTWGLDKDNQPNFDPVDPTPTWRDPRFGDLGFGPENSLTGTQFMANSVDLAIKVNATEGKLRLWRNTALADLASGSVATLADHTVGYESNEPVDNGYQPAGLIHLSTTTGAVDEYLQDFGTNVASGTTTHHLTQYRAPSGALVFSAGTVQWAWGLDPNHDGVRNAADPRIRQATVNILADMSVYAMSPAPGITASTKSADATAPTAAITSPASGGTITQGSLVTVTGTASDVGGKVGGVEVTTDGGASWHSAVGRESFTYSDILTASGAGAIQARATDDSGNIQTTTAKVSVTSPCPCSIFGVITPRTEAATDSTDVTLGVRFTAATDGFISGVRFYKGPGNTGTHTGTLYGPTGSVLKSGSFTDESSSGWQTLVFDSAVPITAGTTYTAAYHAPVGHYAADQSFFASRGRTSGTLTALGGPGKANGVFVNGDGYPTQTSKSTNYYVDVMYSTTDTTPTLVSAVTPSMGATSVSTNTLVGATFSKAVTSPTLQLFDPDNSPVAGTATYAAGTKTITFNPTQGLATGTTYTATASAPGMAAPHQWSFKTAAAPSAPGVCPCTLFDDNDQPTSGPDDDTVKVQLGMAFKSSKAGQITGVRFYKNVQNTGTHTVALWDGSTKKAEATVSDETTSGWQQATFDSPVSITAGTTYVASYTAPKGRYFYTGGGLSSSLSKGPLSSVAGGGRYTYGTGAPGGTSNTNYFVDPVFEPAAGAAPTVAAVSPGNGATSVPVAKGVSVTFASDVQPGSATIVMKRKSDGSTVAGNTSSESAGPIATFRPSDDLLPGTEYTVTVSEARSSAGTPMEGSSTTSFTTAGADACPCSLMETTTVPRLSDSEDPSSVTLGVKFTPSVNGFVKGLRYYRDAANNGSHTGTLYDASKAKLATVTFGNGSPGWQTAAFDSPVSVSAGQAYVAAYFAPSGRYSADVNGFAQPAVNPPLSTVGTSSVWGNGDTYPNNSYMSTNYYVDVVFTTNDTDPPSVSSVSPANEATVTVETVAKATFARPIDQTTLAFGLKDAAGSIVNGQLSYHATTHVATLTPATALPYSTTFTATVSASSASGVAMSVPKTWTFSTGAPPPAGQSVSLFQLTDTPSVAAWDDNDPVTVGVRFSSSVPGSVTGIRFYAGPGNTGGQKVTVWSPTGDELATGIASGSGTGWRTVTFGNPVVITVGAVYTASYYAPTGHYAVTSGTFAADYTSGPLTVPRAGSTYRYPSGFPQATSYANYWVDVIVVV